ncbi:MAG: phenylalanine--tRNA ligase subunit alpha [Proteobacteria bacterium]|jgi:phenylalanyl-tRNA synthetase alpha chain|nr:phenylalanine--tRNA ligase subunit alpha [Pseudomonadota bacterium]
MTDLSTLEQEIFSGFANIKSKTELENFKIEILGKKGKLSKLFQDLATIEKDKKKEFASEINILKSKVLDKFQNLTNQFDQEELEKKLQDQTVDVTLPGTNRPQGKVHPVSQVIDELTSIFAELGFSVAEGPDVENEYNNFTALNTPPNHPARDMHDTFYLDESKNLLLRTHTSPVQIRTMLNGKPPFKIIAPGRTYRCDSDQTHTPMFHQLEGLYVDQNVTMADLRGCLDYFLKKFFEVDEIKMRFRPSHFPFTEPSAEVDIGYELKNGKITIGQGDKWLEILGCGMVHPNVLKNAKVDPSKYQGYAFGVGIDRLAMLKYGINDLRSFFESDVRWLEHFGFNANDVPSNYRGLSR